MLATIGKTLVSLPFWKSSSAENQVCDPVEPLASFDAAAYMGVWYDIQHTPYVFQPDSAKCTTAHYYDLNAEAGTFTVTNKQQYGILPPSGVTGTGSVAGQPNGWVIVSFFGQEFDQPNYKVIDTDYVSYSMVYNCVENDPTNTTYFWILSRTPTMSADKLNELNAKAATLIPHYDFSQAHLTTQNDTCKYDNSFWTF